MSELWFTENQAEGVALSIKATRTLFRRTSEYQDVMVLQTASLGKMLVIDGTVQLTEMDEFVYHEMLAHVPLCAHPGPKSALVIGGGDGGTVREILKHPSIKRVDLVEIDETVLEASRLHLPQFSKSLEDRRVSVIIGDGVGYVESTSNRYDVVLVDSTDPVGKAKPLFETKFYSAISRVLLPDGIVVAQTESPFFHANLIGQVNAAAREWFPLVATYLAPVPTYPGGLWSLTSASRTTDPVKPKHAPPPDLRYYTPEIHASSFRLPRFLQETISSPKAKRMKDIDE